MPDKQITKVIDLLVFSTVPIASLRSTATICASSTSTTSPTASAAVSELRPGTAYRALATPSLTATPRSRTTRLSRATIPSRATRLSRATLPSRVTRLNPVLTTNPHHPTTRPPTATRRPHPTATSSLPTTRPNRQTTLQRRTRPRRIRRRRTRRPSTELRDHTRPPRGKNFVAFVLLMFKQSCDDVRVSLVSLICA